MRVLCGILSAFVMGLLPRPLQAQQVRDSAGVRIVQYSAMPSNLPVWRLASSPDLRIGAADGPGPDVFGSITDLAVRSDGSLIVADGRSFQIKAFDSSGKSLWS